MKTVHASSPGNNSTQSAATDGNPDSIICHRCKQADHIACFCGNKPELWCNFCRKTSRTDSTCRNRMKVNKTSKDFMLSVLKRTLQLNISFSLRLTVEVVM